jgi:16S rRNA (adenine(1408)-N(1))-methyltransferase
MAEVSLRAARPARKGGLPNVLFAVAAAERPPGELCGRADEVTILFPWGSLLRGVLALDPGAAAGIAGLLAPGGRVRALVSVTDRDEANAGLAPLRAADRDGLAKRWAAFGLRLTAFEPATAADIHATGSTWARRLGAARRAGRGATPSDARPVWRLALRCTGPDDDGG